MSPQREQDIHHNFAKAFIKDNKKHILENIF